MKKRLDRRFVLVGTVMLFIILVEFMVIYFSNQYALYHFTFKDVTPNQLALAMQHDDFYSDYRENTVIFTGQVTSTTLTHSHTIVGIKTTVPYYLQCEVSGHPANIKVGSNYKFAAEAYNSTRQSSNLLMHTCVVLN